MEGTIFLALLGFAFFFMVYRAHSQRDAFAIISIVLFLSLSVMMFGGEDIYITSTVTTTMTSTLTNATTTATGTETGTETVMIPIITHNVFSPVVLGWLFFLLAMLNLLTFFSVALDAVTNFFRRRREVSM